MREIKFRVWDDVDNEIATFDPEDWPMETGNEKLGAFLTNYFGCELMQFTGLTDKNGVDIYEDDLIELHENKNGCVQVCFKNAYVGGWVLAEDKELENYVSLGARASCDIEVIGNIHENPELLEAKP